MPRVIVLLGLLALVSTARAQAVPPLVAEQWKFDVVHRKRGADPLCGLVTEETPAYVRIKRVFRTPGKPTIVINDTEPRETIARVQLLDDKERALLRTRLETLERERKVLIAQTRFWKGGKVELPASEMLELKPAPWGPGGKGKALSYESTAFRLVSNAREDIVLLTAIQLEQVFTAYARCLPPPPDSTRMTTVMLTRSVDEYMEQVKARGHNILNPAFFDPREKQVVCGSDVERLGKELDRVQENHATLLKDLRGRRAELVRIYKGLVPPELLGPIDEAIKRIEAIDARNADVVKFSHLRLVQCLCHEAFHAYLHGLFDERKLRVPAWLDEGLAQVFETALVEGGELQVGIPDPERLKRVKAALEKAELLPLTDLLKSTARQFQVAHTQEKSISDRYYLSAWALAFYLTYEKKTLGSGALDDYLKALERGGDPLDAFSTLLGESLGQAEKNWHQYLKDLRPDGSVAKK